MLKQALIESGFLADIISWEDTEINFNEYSCLILRSVWGYQDKYESFKKWLLFIKKSNIKIFNDVEILLNNIRKDVQFEILDRHSIPHISTMFIKQLHELELLENIKNDMVIKPIISGSGNNTYRISQLCNSAFENTIQVSNIISKFKPIFDMKDNGAMIQPYISEIKNGEFSCIFIDGVNTHNMLRFPGLFLKKKPIYLNAVPEDVRKLANCVSKLQEYNNYLYMRIDIIYNNGIQQLWK